MVSINFNINDCSNEPTQHVLFQGANVFFVISFLVPNRNHFVIPIHLFLTIGYFLYSLWAWKIVCQTIVFGWNFTLMIINFGQSFFLIYTMRKVKFSKELEEVYQYLFKPMKISRLLFQKLVSSEYAQIITLQIGESYATENITRSDRLGLLVSGRVNVTSNNHYLHSIEPKQFLDSPEFESSKTGKEDKFNVTITASMPCTYILWQRQALDYLLIKETFLATTLNLILARDVTDKLYAMNEKIVTEKGTHLDIRLPGVTTSLCNSATSLATDSSDHLNNEGSTSPMRMPKLGLRVKDRNFATKGSRSKSLQTNSLGVAVLNSSRIAQGIKSTKRDSLDPTHIFTHFDNGLLNVSPLHGVRFKVEKSNQ